MSGSTVPDRSSDRPRVTVESLRTMRERGAPIVMLTAYEFVSARVAEAAGVDVALVGDSGAMTVLGHPSTRDVSLDEMLMLARAVRRGLRTPLLVGDLPYGSYEASDDLALESAGKFVDAGCDAVKLEGAGAMVDRVRAIVAAGIPVMGHVGLTPQRFGGPEGMRVQGKSAEAALALLHDARALDAAGCFAIVLEAVPAEVAAVVTEQVAAPTIGIGAGAGVSGQVLVFHDLLGMWSGRVPRFVRQYAALEAAMVDAVARWRDDVRSRRFPAGAESYAIAAEELARFRELVAAQRA